MTRLCGGKALMAASRDPMAIDMGRAAEALADMGPVKHLDEFMLVIDWNGIEVTLYPQGKVMFHPLADRDLAVEYATSILARVSGA